MKEREAFLDKMRVAATFAVVLLHTVTGVMDTTDMAPYPVERKVFLVVMDLVCWCVPVFLMISGYLFLQPKRGISMGRMLTKYCRRILLALFLFGVPYACLEQMMTQRRFRLGMVGEAFLMVLRGESWSHMWYLYLILVLYLATPSLKWALARIPVGAVYGLEAVLCSAFSILPYLSRRFGWGDIAAMPDWGIYLFYYICGYLFAVHDPCLREGARKSKGQCRRKGTCKSKGQCQRKGTWQGRALPALAALVAAGMVLGRTAGGCELRMAYNNPFIVLCSLLLFGWGAGTEKKPQTGQSPMGQPEEGRCPGLGCTGGYPFWERAAELSFTVYLIHPVFLNMAYKLFHVTPLSFAIGISLPAFFLGTLLLSAAGAWALQRIAPLRKYVL